MRFLIRFGPLALLVLLVVAFKFVNAGSAKAKQYPADGTAVSVPVPTFPLTLSQERDSIVTREARRAGVPAALAVALSHVENTSGDSLALSNRGAVGLMQVMPQYWLDAWPTECYGERRLYDRERNACVGVRVLLHYRQRSGSWLRAMCSYHGSSGVVCQKYTDAVISNLQ